MEIIDGRTVLRVVLLSPPEETPPDADPASDVDVFLKWWREECRRRDVPPPVLAGRERRITTGLLRRHPVAELKRLGVMFWRWYARPITEDGYPHHLVLFSAKLKDVVRDAQQMEA